jgi:demethylmenaquinone methyltransferase/2-methoxy-6-polyprenyl-1,4-benzoquinol methylase
MQEYYARRADQYERIYARPERQTELAEMRALIERAFVGCRVLDVACGTGYFTQFAARGASSVTAIDVNVDTLAIARSKGIANATFAIGDAYDLPPREPYDGGWPLFGGPVPRQRRERISGQAASTACSGRWCCCRQYLCRGQ